MLYVDIPTPKEIADLNLVRSEACVSIYLSTTPLTQKVGKSRTQLGHLWDEAAKQLETSGLEKRVIWQFEEKLQTVMDDDDFWAHQAHSLAILMTPNRLRTYRLPSELVNLATVSDRFHLKPLLRAVSFPNAANILAISENAVRLIEMSADTPAVEIKVPDMPKDAASAVGKSTINDSGAGRRIQGMEGQKIRLGQYIRKVDAALRPILAQAGVPLILAATKPVADLFVTLSSLETLEKIIETSPDDMSEAELANAARPILDSHYDEKIANFHALFKARVNEGRATTDMSDAARAATFGGIDTILVDIDSIVEGSIDEISGAVEFAEDGNAGGYGIVDEIAGRSLRTGAQVLAVRRQDIPDERSLAAILRYPV